MTKYALILIVTLLFLGCKKEVKTPEKEDKKEDAIQGIEGMAVFLIDSIQQNLGYSVWKKDEGFPAHYISLLEDMTGYFHKDLNKKGSSYYAGNKHILHFFYSKDSVYMELENHEPFVMHRIFDDSLEYWQSAYVRFFVHREEMNFLKTPQIIYVDTTIERYTYLNTSGQWYYHVLSSRRHYNKEKYIFLEQNSWGFQE